MTTVISTIGLIVLGLVPSFSWLAFYRHEHLRHPEPRLMVFLAFLVGCVVTFLVLPVQLFLNERLALIGVSTYTFNSFLVLAFTEELFKFVGVYLLMWRRSEFHEPLNAMVYMIVAALGFAAVENIASLFKVADGSLLNIDVFESVVLRFAGATLLHTLASGIVGYYWGLLAFVRPNHKARLIITGLVIATVLHAIFNLLIITTGPADVAIVFVSFVMFFVLNDFEKLKKVDLT